MSTKEASSSFKTCASKAMFWSVFDGFDFLLNVMATHKEEALELALVQLGWSADKGPSLSVFLAGDTVTTLAARNTFGLFQEHGGVALNWPLEGDTRSISREDCKAMLASMRVWVDQPEATLLALSVGSDLDYVRAQIADIEGLLSNPRWSCFEWVVFRPFHNDDREAEEDAARADAYSNALYTTTPED
jgi:hypothetical protein